MGGIEGLLVKAIPPTPDPTSLPGLRNPSPCEGDGPAGQPRGDGQSRISFLNRLQGFASTRRKLKARAEMSAHVGNGTNAARYPAYQPARWLSNFAAEGTIPAWLSRTFKLCGRLPPTEFWSRICSLSSRNTAMAARFFPPMHIWAPLGWICSSSSRASSWRQSRGTHLGRNFYSVAQRVYCRPIGFIRPLS